MPGRLSTHANECCSSGGTALICGVTARMKSERQTKWDVTMAAAQGSSRGPRWLAERQLHTHMGQDAEATADKQETSRWETDSDTCRERWRCCSSLHCLGFLLRHSARGYVFTPSEDIWQHLAPGRSNVTKLDVCAVESWGSAGVFLGFEFLDILLLKSWFWFPLKS